MRRDKDNERGLRQVEGFLMWHAEVAQAQRDATAFTERLPWLTTAQREEVERVYVDDRTAASRVMLQRICDRAVELRAEYAANYLRMKARCVAATATVAGLVVGADAFVLLVR
ncbi:hypothetical protein [Actinacidiphila acidipaludis]|uniref:Uncharacterized protein n=1 Tax=Actinacidiphila acidipaludis TaxID=2873382 RepID=A0ABS7Q9W6_9ACTN|nr:hypothetical protein [Streptomyces acidipaludis]MBY8879631.1 hypothetical protein [Streptomyces acidipaludis]